MKRTFFAVSPFLPIESHFSHQPMKDVEAISVTFIVEKIVGCRLGKTRL
jgi:hypothetical protein